MTRNPVSAGQIDDPVVAAALSIHVSERSRILASLSVSFERDERIRVGWLWGSFMRGEQDDLSDLDIWLLVAPGTVNQLGGVIEQYCREAGSVVCCGENAHNAPKGGGYFSALLAGSHGLHHLDIYWQEVGDAEVPDAPLLLNRIGEPAPEVAVESVAVHEGEESELEQCRGKFAFVWLMLSVAAKYLARDPASDMKLMSYPRNAFEETAAILGIQDQVGETQWSAPDEPQAKVELLRQVARKTATLEEECQARGLRLSTEVNSCLMRYFDLVEGILKIGSVNA